MTTDMIYKLTWTWRYWQWHHPLISRSTLYKVNKMKTCWTSYDVSEKSVIVPAVGFDELRKRPLGLTLSSRLLSEWGAASPTSVSKQTISPPRYLPHSDLLAYSALARGGCAAFPACRSSRLPVRTTRRTWSTNKQRKKETNVSFEFRDLAWPSPSIPTAVYGREIYPTDTHLTSDPEVKRR